MPNTIRHSKRSPGERVSDATATTPSVDRIHYPRQSGAHYQEYQGVFS